MFGQFGVDQPALDVWAESPLNDSHSPPLVLAKLSDHTGRTWGYSSRVDDLDGPRAVEGEDVVCRWEGAIAPLVEEKRPVSPDANLNSRACLRMIADDSGKVEVSFGRFKRDALRIHVLRQRNLLGSLALRLSLSLLQVETIRPDTEKDRLIVVVPTDQDAVVWTLLRLQALADPLGRQLVHILTEGLRDIGLHEVVLSLLLALASFAVFFPFLFPSRLHVSAIGPDKHLELILIGLERRELDLSSFFGNDPRLRDLHLVPQPVITEIVTTEILFFLHLSSCYPI
mmetsp:Transcript_3647/g.12963  ORF Transcript_3647/g.12963 Transcript_3647/m.12963 type:complete len:285 (-) Transcript_3647:309-1163(-)